MFVFFSAEKSIVRTTVLFVSISQEESKVIIEFQCPNGANFQFPR